MTNVLRRLHHGRPGIWAVAALSSLGSVTVGLLFLFDGKGAVSSPAYDPARHFLTGVGVHGRAAMHVWGVVFIVLGGYALAPLLQSRRLLARGYALVPLAALWLMWSAMFLAYSIRHAGLGAVGAVVWAVVAANMLAAAMTMFAHARTGE